MSGLYPIVLDLRGRACLVVGGGPVAQGKVDGLLAAGAFVTVVSPDLTPGLATRVAEGAVQHRARVYHSGDLGGHGLVFTATDDRAVTRQVAEDARAHGVWVNAADEPEFCDFLLPAVLRRGRLTVAVSTGGASPALAGAIRRELETHVTEDYGRLVEIVAEVRRDVRAGSEAPRPEVWRRALDRELLRLVAEGRPEMAKARLRERLRQAVEAGTEGPDA